MMHKFYLNLKEKFLDLFSPKKPLSSEQRDYILSGINKDLLTKYKIVYNSNYTSFKPDKEGTKIKRSIERIILPYSEIKKLPSARDEAVKYIKQIKKELKEQHRKNMETIKLNYQRHVTKMASDFVSNFNSKLTTPREILVNDSRNGLTFYFNK